MCAFTSACAGIIWWSVWRRDISSPPRWTLSWQAHRSWRASSVSSFLQKPGSVSRADVRDSANELNSTTAVTLSTWWVTGWWHTECILGIVCEQSVVKMFEMIVQPKLTFCHYLLTPYGSISPILSLKSLILFMFSKCSPRLHLFIQKYIKIMKYYTNFKYFKM